VRSQWEGGVDGEECSARIRILQHQLTKGLGEGETGLGLRILESILRLNGQP